MAVNPNWAGDDFDSMEPREAPLTPADMGGRKHWHQRSHTMRRIMSTVGIEESKRQLFRDETPAGAHAERHNPVKKLCGATCLVIILLLGSLSAFNANMIVIFANTGGNSLSNGFMWNYGINSKKFIDKSTSTSALTTAQTLTLTQTNKYHRDSGNITKATIIISLVLCFYVLFVLYVRNEFDLLLYLKCCGRIKIPQRGSIYEAYKLIKIMTAITVIGWIFLGIYGSSEFSLKIFCGSGQCLYLPYPHYGAALLLLIQIVLVSCGDRWLLGMDVKFGEKTMKYYFPENVKLAEKNQTLDLHQLLDMISACFNICFLMTTVMFMRESQLLNVVVTVNESAGSFAVAPFGFNIDTSIDPNSNELKILATACVYAYYGMGAMLLFSFIVGMFLCYAVHKYSHLNCCVLLIIRFYSLLQLIVWTASVGGYYYLFFAFWSASGKNKQDWVDLGSGLTLKSQYFLPDWGAVICIVIEIFIFKLVWKAFFRLGKIKRLPQSADSMHNLEMMESQLR